MREGRRERWIDGQLGGRNRGIQEEIKGGI
jgi:hypothetical protein